MVTSSPMATATGSRPSRGASRRPARVYRVAVRRFDFLLDTLPDFLLDPFADDRLTLAGRKPRAFAHARQRPTRNGLTAVLLSSTYFEHRSTLSHWMHF
jgi:hypothetical protein